MIVHAKGKFVLGDGESGVAGDVDFNLQRAAQCEIACDGIVTDPHRDEVESAIHDWLSGYVEKGIYLRAEITRIGIDPARKMDHRRAVSIAFYELYPLKGGAISPASIYMTFEIDEIDGYLDELEKIGIKITKKPWLSGDHQHVVIEDYEGNLIELVTKK